MAKKVAVLAVNPVNGMGLFQYLEAFYENRIPFRVFAVAPSKDIRTNSGVALQADDAVASLKGRAEEYDALVFACGDAVPVFLANADQPYNRDLMQVLAEFGAAGKIMAGHCGAGMMFDAAGIASGRKVAVHPLAKGAVQKAVATDGAAETDGPFYTAREEHALPELMPRLLEALK